ncbi:polygalacturonase-like protein isoform X2 [Cinnamomum micranthum f. kanehirae]|uniref:Polygalacturonase-like protein isoform X2 n=1 Tax=Cinnamomum micranthum f. kanehirae TaxID=337451 RepID=A0A3S3N8L7_9MAGN|nr:polygalacturonase-like protein isoform X2 [Cinnamomum micranthum f. kanehirae]
MIHRHSRVHGRRLAKLNPPLLLFHDSAYDICRPLLKWSHISVFWTLGSSLNSVKVNGVPMPPDGPDSWPKNNSRRQWLVFYRMEGMSLQGDGTIDGKGEKWWNLPYKPHKAIRFFMSSNLTVKGLKIRTSPQFHFQFDECKNVLINTIVINSPPHSPNTDGFHVENSDSI